MCVEGMLGTGALEALAFVYLPLLGRAGRGVCVICCTCDPHACFLCVVAGGVEVLVSTSPARGGLKTVWKRQVEQC